MKYKSLSIIMMLILLCGCDKVNQENLPMVSSDNIAVDEIKEMENEETEIIEPKQEVVEVGEEISENQEESIEEAEEEKITIAPEDIVYEENDIVFVIVKSCNEFGPNEYGYLISAGGKVVPFQISYEDLRNEYIDWDYSKIVDMETAEPLKIIESENMNQYITMLKSIDINHELEVIYSGAEVHDESSWFLARKMDKEKSVEDEWIYSESPGIWENPTDPNAIALKEWLSALSDELTGIGHDIVNVDNVEKTITADEIVYEEDDIVFVISKGYYDAREYGYFITASGEVFPFQEVYGGMERTDYINASQMQEPILILEKEEVNYYIDQLKNIRLEHQIKGARYAFGLMFENILLYGRRIDEDGKVEIEKIYYNTPHSEGWAYEPEGEAVMSWLLELNDRLPQEQEGEN